jgi:hypothetical protein
MVTRPKDLRKYFKYLRTFTEETPVERKSKNMSLLNTLAARTNGRIGSQQIDILSDFDYDTWLFLDNVKDVMYGIQDWKVVDNVMDVVEEFSYELPLGSNKSKTEPKAAPPIS